MAHRFRLLSMALVVGVVLPAAAWAVPAASYSGVAEDTVTTDAKPLVGPGTAHASTTGISGSYTSSVTFSATGPLISSSMISTPRAGFFPPNGAFINGPSGSGEITYWVELVGPSGTVPLDITATGAASASGTVEFADSFIEAESVTGNNIIFCAQAAVVEPLCAGSSSFSGTVALTEAANTLFTIYLQADSFGYANYAGTASAFVDPLISIDPSFANANLYTLEISPDIRQGNGAATGVPEPASVFLFGIGLAGLGAIRHRRTP
jgi:hypothetical protein